MSREQKYTAIILKKQPFKEGDEIITLFTKERGKLRALAKSVKSAKSKLQQKLQQLFLVELTLTAGSLPKIIAAEPVKVFAGLRQNLEASKTAFYAAELVMKFTPDEHKSEALFGILHAFLEFLDSAPQADLLAEGLAKFKITILEASGFGIHSPKNVGPKEKIFFSRFKGGFSLQKSGDALEVSRNTYENFSKLNSIAFPNLAETNINLQNLAELQHLLSGFIEYHLERRIKSEKYLGNMV